MDAFVQHSGKNAVIIFRFDNLEEAISLLQKEGVHIYKGEEVYKLKARQEARLMPASPYPAAAWRQEAGFQRHVGLVNSGKVATSIAIN